MQEAKREDAAKVSAELSERVHKLESKLAESVAQQQQAKARTLTMGTRVVLQGLIVNIELNGKYGTVLGCNDQGTLVVLEDEDGTDECVLCKPECVVPIQCADPSVTCRGDANAGNPARANLWENSGHIPAQPKGCTLVEMMSTMTDFEPNEETALQIGGFLLATAVFGYFWGVAFTLELLAVALFLFIGFYAVRIYFAWVAVVLVWWLLAWLSSLQGLSAPPQTEFFCALLASQQTALWCAVATLMILACNVFGSAAKMVIIARKDFRRRSATTEEAASPV